MLKSFVLVLIGALLSSSAYATNNNNSGKKNQAPVIDAYISLQNESNLRAIRVNLQNSYDSDGKIEKYEIDFGDGFKTNKADAIHAYGSDANYTIRIKVWDNKDLKSEYSKVVQIRSNLVFVEGTTVFNANKVKENKNYDFNVLEGETNKIYKLVLTKNQRGAAFKNKAGKYTYALWAAIKDDMSEFAKDSFNGKLDQLSQVTKSPNQ